MKRERKIAMKSTWKKILCGTMTAAMLLGTVPAAQAATPFADVASDSWYVNFVDYAYNHKLMAGTSDTTFAPNQIMTRGMLVTVLHSIAGKPSHSGNNPFGDVGDSWYTNAVIWCYENGIVAGTSATTFSPNSPVTREQMVAILFKFAEANGLDTSGRSPAIASYSDSLEVSGWAADAFSWALYEGVVNGTSDTTLSPKDKATRAQCAVVLQRYHELLTSNAQPQPQPQPTEPAPAPTEPKPTEHVHKWVHHHEDAQYYDSEYCVCNYCGWSFCVDRMPAEEFARIWTEHQYAGYDKGEQHSYTFEFRQVETKPAVDYWTCSCGETTDVNPG